jgi:hypothetical protein
MGRSAVIWGVLAFGLARLAIDAAALAPLAEHALLAQRLLPLLIGAPLLVGPVVLLAALSFAPRRMERAFAAAVRAR